MQRIFLTGYMGAGKTTLGRDLSDFLGLSFIDLDVFIEERFHKTIRQIFAERGEEAFRELERRMLHEVAEFEDIIVSTGGGTPCFFDNMSFMNACGQTVYLRISIDELAARLEMARQTRPVLQNRTGEALKAFIRESLESRLPFYEQARFIFDAETMDTHDDVRKLSERLAQILAQ